MTASRRLTPRQGNKNPKKTEHKNFFLVVLEIYLWRLPFYVSQFISQIIKRRKRRRILLLIINKVFYFWCFMGFIPRVNTLLGRQEIFIAAKHGNK